MKKINIDNIAVLWYNIVCFRTAATWMHFIVFCFTLRIDTLFK